MTNQEAKFILSAYRARGGDTGDAVFGEALAQAKRDPELGAWFAREQAHDAAIRAKLAETPPPAGLRDAILAGSRVSRTRRRAALPWMGLAAGIAVIFATSLALWPKRAAAESTRMAEFALEDTAHGQHGGHGSATGALQVMLSQPGTHLGGDLPVDFETLRATGCRTLNFNGHDVLEICFERSGKWFHCYIARRADFPALSDVAAVFTQKARLSAASWSNASYHFVVVGESSVDEVKRLL